MSRPPKAPPRAAALRYDHGQDEAPVLVAKGSGSTADWIVEIAREHGIPIHEDPSLVEVLSKLDVQQRIPEELYLIVAEILACIYRAQAIAGGEARSGG
jgi:flagellar biosynthesis protein